MHGGPSENHVEPAIPNSISTPAPKPSTDRIAPLSADLAADGRTRALALKKLHRICEARGPQALKPITP